MIKIIGNCAMLTNIINAYKHAENKEEETAAARLLEKVRVVC